MQLSPSINAGEYEVSILVCDDVPDIRHMLVTLFHMDSYFVHSARRIRAPESAKELTQTKQVEVFKETLRL